MVITLLDAVTKHLGTNLGTDYKYYVENVEQGLVKPCFTLDVLSPTERSKSPILYDRTMPLVVHYFSDRKNEIKKDCYEMAERVLEYLEYIPFMGSMIRGEDISWQITDDVLQIFITYRFTTKMSKETEENMEEILENFVQPN